VRTGALAVGGELGAGNIGLDGEVSFVAGDVREVLDDAGHNTHSRA
jgi:hypothetical protein